MKRSFYIPLFLLLIGCNAPQEKKTNARIIFDQTEERIALDPKDILSTLGIDYGSLTLTEITDQSLSKEITVSIEASPSYLMRVESKEREKEKTFTEDFMAALGAFNRRSEGMPESHVYSVLAHSCDELAKSDADAKRILIFGDLLHHVKGEFSFYTYRRNPTEIREKYGEITETLEGYYPDIKDSDLRGISISVVFFPSKENDRLYREVRSFWTHYFTGKNAVIEFLTSLPDSQISTL